LHFGPRLGIERCGKINTVNSGSESWTGIGVVAGCAVAVLIRQWPHMKNGDVTWERELLQILQKVRTNCKTRNQLHQNRVRDTLEVAHKINIVLRRSGDRLCGNQLGTGLQAMQLSPHHAGLAGLRFLRLLCASRFSAMLLFPSLSASGKAADL